MFAQVQSTASAGDHHARKPAWQLAQLQPSPWLHVPTCPMPHGISNTASDTVQPKPHKCRVASFLGHPTETAVCCTCKRRALNMKLHIMTCTCGFMITTLYTTYSKQMSSRSRCMPIREHKHTLAHLVSIHTQLHARLCATIRGAFQHAVDEYHAQHVEAVRGLAAVEDELAAEELQGGLHCARIIHGPAYRLA